MAIDTAAKRKSCIGIAAPWNRTGVIPDGSNLSAAQRLHADYLYSGIPSSAPGGVTLMAMERSKFRRVFGRIFGRVN
jgi:hypothetical protein